MIDLPEKVLQMYPFENPSVVFVRHNENKVYQVKAQNKLYILRIHQPIEGFSLDLHQDGRSLKDYILGEMDVLAYLHDKGHIKVQKPVRNLSNDLVSFLDDGTPVTVLEWLDGEVMNVQDVSEERARSIGRLVGLFHKSTRDMTVNNRYSYNQDMIVRMRKKLEAFHQHKKLEQSEKDFMMEVLDKVYQAFNDIKKPSILVHYDFGLSNLIIKDDDISPIDFSLCGYGYEEMDLSSLCANFKDVSLRKAVIKGYEEATNTNVDIHLVEVFLALGLMLYIISQFEKIYKEEWFHKAMIRWKEELFVPLINGEFFLFTQH